MNECNCDTTDHTHRRSCSNYPSAGNQGHFVVETYAEVQSFHNAFVTVRDENAVYHVDEAGNPVSVSRSPIFKDNYVAVAGDYKQNTVYDFATNSAYIFNPAGAFKKVTLI